MQTSAVSRLSSDAIAVSDAEPVVVDQAGAICFRRESGGERFEVLLISGRTTGLWGIPKGHLEHGEDTAAAAAREAFEEAGVIGTALKDEVGGFTYSKIGNAAVYQVQVHLIAVASMASDYPEKGARTIQWVPASLAAALVGQPGLRTLLAERLGGLGDCDLESSACLARS
ncbi:NUDIX hydrolase [Ensifer adhaerens]|uniref:NUDIX hydrolase n=1 Tax=Ensifer adhaerens TaxID=106592 RepID=UPI0011774BC3|nr:NUDIX domain-containing protein [Ensifer adhaerens]